MPKRKSCCGLPWYLIYNSFDSSKYRHNDPHQLYKVYPLYDFISHYNSVSKKCLCNFDFCLSFSRYCYKCKAILKLISLT